jgi:hypothetical protein
LCVDKASDLIMSENAFIWNCFFESNFPLFLFHWFQSYFYVFF